MITYHQSRGYLNIDDLYVIHKTAWIHKGTTLEAERDRVCAVCLKALTTHMFTNACGWCSLYKHSDCQCPCCYDIWD